jgi:hypothetical protein
MCIANESRGIQESPQIAKQKSRQGVRMSLRDDDAKRPLPPPLVATKYPVRSKIQTPASARWLVAPRLLFTARSHDRFRPRASGGGTLPRDAGTSRGSRGRTGGLHATDRPRRRYAPPASELWRIARRRLGGHRVFSVLREPGPERARAAGYDHPIWRLRGEDQQHRRTTALEPGSDPIPAPGARRLRVSVPLRHRRGEDHQRHGLRRFGLPAVGRLLVLEQHEQLRREQHDADLPRAEPLPRRRGPDAVHI